MGHILDDFVTWFRGLLDLFQRPSLCFEFEAISFVIFCTLCSLTFVRELLCFLRFFTSSIGRGARGRFGA